MSEPARGGNGHRGLKEMGIDQQVAFLNSILESSSEYSIVAMDLAGTILAWNAGARRIYGYEAADVVGKATGALLHHPDDVKSGRAKAILEEAVRTGKWEGELRRARKTGAQFTAHVTLTLRRDPQGAPIGFTMISRDVTRSEQIERELRESQEYNRGLVESNIDALMTTDPLGLITDVNRQMCAMTGYSREELIGTPFKRYFTDPQRAEDGIRRVLAEDRVTNYELTMRSRTGKETVVSYNATTFKGAEGRLRGVFAAARDITDQKLLEEALRQTQNYTRGLIEASVDALMTVDPEFRITDVNEQMVRMTEAPKERLIGSRFDAYFTEPDRAAAGVKKTLNEGYVTNYELTLKTPGGREVLVSFNASIFKDPEGNVRGVFAVARDVTDQRRLELQLREQQNYSRGLIEASAGALMTVDPNGVITDVNEQTAKLTGYNRKQLIGSPFAQYFTDPELARAGVRTTFDEGVVTNYELVVRSKAGRKVAVSFNAAVFADATGAVQGILAAARDITQQKQIEQELREQQTYTRGLVESGIDALMTTDLLGLITDVNRRMCEITGRARDELIGTPFKDYFTDPRRAEDGIRRVLAEDQVTNYELTIRARDGAETVVSYNATTFKGADGRLRGVFAAARDITAQKGLEEQLREQQAHSRGLIESSVDGMLTVDAELTITDVNEQMVNLSGYARDQLIGSAFQDYFTEPDRAAAGVRKTLSEGYATNYELTLRSRHRREILVSLNASVFKDAAGNVRGVFA